MGSERHFVNMAALHEAKREAADRARAERDAWFAYCPPLPPARPPVYRERGSAQK